MSEGGKHPAKGEENISKVKDKIQRLFGRGKSNASLTIQKPSTQEVIFTPEILKEIGPESPANNRLKTIGQLCEEVKQRQLENNAVEALWGQISDLIQPNVATENRHLALQFLQCLLQGQLQYMTILREHFFNVISTLKQPEDMVYRVELFSTLSEGGKNLLYFEEETGPLLLEWMPEVTGAGHISKLLPIILNVVKYNFVYMDEHITSAIIKKTCELTNRPKSEEELKLCLDLMDAVIRYGYLPNDSLYHFIAALCLTVAKPPYAETTWSLMRKLLGTHLGHTAIYTMCCMLQDRRQPVNALLLRGAIFFTGMALWGPRKVTTLKHTPASVLPSFHQALFHGNSIVAYEVILNVQRLVKKYGKDLHSLAWDIVMDILEKLLTQIDEFSFEQKISDETHCVISLMESLYTTRQFFGLTARLFKLVEMKASNRPTSSVCALMDYHMQSIHPGVDHWIQDLNALMEKYLKGQNRSEVRKKALDVLSLVISINSHTYEKELIEEVVVPHFTNIENDPDPQVRCKAVELLLTLCEDCNSNLFFQLAAIVEKIIMKPGVLSLAENETTNSSTNSQDSRQIDIHRAVKKTIEVLRSKLYTAPASHFRELYSVLTNHMEMHYQHMYLGHTACSIRKAIFDFLVLLRSDSDFRVGLTDRKPGQGHLFSPYVLCHPSEDWKERMMKSPGLSGMTVSEMYSVIEYEHTFKAFLSCLESERDWLVLQTVLEKLPLILENKTLILSADGGFIDTLCAKLCAVVKDRRTSEKIQMLINRPNDFTRSDLHAFFFPVLASMVNYHASLDRSRLRELVNCLEFGLVSKCAKICVTTLRICSLEMKELMMRMLPTVLLSLSRITATISMAIPVLAFLSSIVRIPMLYANFVEDQYMSVFAIALPYTNPFKFSHYTVSLAHHVIGVWFIRCRLPFRKGFVKYIQRGLKCNVLKLFEENSLRHLSNNNQNSSDRGRSGSLNEGKKRTRNVSGLEGARNNNRIPMDESMSQFHKELTETCVDMMSRYAFGNYSAFPKKSPIVEFLLKGGQKDQWVVGNKVITITTSGSGNPANPSGMCDKCMVAFQNFQSNQMSSTSSASTSSSSSSRNDRRRHKSMASLGHSTRDDQTSIDGEDGVRRHRYHDDMQLLQEQPQTSSSISSTNNAFDEVGVQTGTSLGIGGDFTGLDSMTAELQEHRAFLSTQCSCWCTGWAEVHIRGASGVISWMMRITNDPSSYSFSTDPAIPDITQLLAPVRCKTPDTESLGKIDSGSLCEEEYETLHSQHFSDAEKRLFQEEGDCSVQSSLKETSTAPQQVPEQSSSNTNNGGGEVLLHSPSSLRRISSSPSLTYGPPLVADMLTQTTQTPNQKSRDSLSPEHIVKRIQVTDSKAKSSHFSKTKADDFSKTEIGNNQGHQQGHGFNINSGSNQQGHIQGFNSGNSGSSSNNGSNSSSSAQEFRSRVSKNISQSDEQAANNTGTNTTTTTTTAANTTDDVSGYRATNSTSCSQTQTVTSPANETRRRRDRSEDNDNDNNPPESKTNQTAWTNNNKTNNVTTSTSTTATSMETSSNTTFASASTATTAVNAQSSKTTSQSPRSPSKRKDKMAGGPSPQRSYSVDHGTDQKRPEALNLTASHHRVQIPRVAEQPEEGNPSSWRDEVPELRQMKRRGHTISVMSSSQEAGSGGGGEADAHYKTAKDGKGGLNPSFVFLQLYHCHPLVQTQDVPIHVPNSEEFQRTVERLDHIYPYEAHRIGVLYMGKGQKSEEKALLSNEYGSARYTQFIQGLGQMVSLEEAEKEKLYLGGLTKEDGKFTIAWNDESLRVIFHVATLMPNKTGSSPYQYKKSHIGNDFVSIVYNDSSEEYKIGTISGQFNFVSIVIRPLDHGSNAVYLVTKEVDNSYHISSDIADILGHTHTKIISDSNLPLLVRQIAIHCNLASMVLQRQQSSVGSPEVFASNWLERLRKIKLLKKRVMEYHADKHANDSSSSGSPAVLLQSRANGDANGMGIEDFTDYV